MMCIPVGLNAVTPSIFQTGLILLACQFAERVVHFEHSGFEAQQRAGVTQHTTSPFVSVDLYCTLQKKRDTYIEESIDKLTSLRF